MLSVRVDVVDYLPVYPLFQLVGVLAVKLRAQLAVDYTGYLRVNDTGNVAAYMTVHTHVAGAVLNDISALEGE